MLHIITFRWGRKYDGHYVERLRAGVERNLNQEHRFEVFSPLAEDEYLTKIPGCFCRLRMFDRAWQERHGIKEGDRIVLVDLDVVITGPLDDLFDREEDFVILSGANSSNPCPVNGSLQMLRAGKHEIVWKDFSLKRAGEVKFDSFPDDQAWIWDRIPNYAEWKAGPESGVYSFQKTTWPKGDALPKDAKIVAFPGWRDPSRFSHLDWVKANWR